MKVLQIVPSYKPAYIYGGPIESVAKLCESLVQGGIIVQVYTTTANGKNELPLIPNTKVLVDGVPVTYFKRITGDNSHLSPALWHHLYQTCRFYDVVHIHSWWSPLVIVCAMICHIHKVPVVISPRGMLSDYILQSTNKITKQLVQGTIGKKILSKCYFHATSRIEWNECKKLIPGWQGFAIPNIVTLPPLAIHKEKNERFTLLFLSRIHPKKGIEFILNALQNISQPVVFRIAGTGEESYIQKLKSRIKELRIEDKVEWIGWQNRQEKFKELMKADLFVLPSYNENFANSVVEALYVGTPVFLSNQVGLALIVEEQNLGWITSLQQDEVTEKLQSIFLQKDKLKWIQEHSREVVDRMFSEKEIISRYIGEYNKILFP